MLVVRGGVAIVQDGLLHLLQDSSMVNHTNTRCAYPRHDAAVTRQRING